MRERGTSVATTKVTMRNVLPDATHEVVLFEVPDDELDAVVQDAHSRWAEVITEPNQE
jgi:hypothetical protein